MSDSESKEKTESASETKSHAFVQYGQTDSVQCIYCKKIFSGQEMHTQTTGPCLAE